MTELRNRLAFSIRADELRRRLGVDHAEMRSRAFRGRARRAQVMYGFDLGAANVQITRFQVTSTGTIRVEWFEPPPA